MKNILKEIKVFKLAPIAEEMLPDRSGGGIGTESGTGVSTKLKSSASKK